MLILPRFHYIIRLPYNCGVGFTQTRIDEPIYEIDFLLQIYPIRFPETLATHRKAQQNSQQK